MTINGENTAFVLWLLRFIHVSLGAHGALNRKVPRLMKLGYVPPKRLLLRADDEVRSPNLSQSTKRYFCSSAHRFRRTGIFRPDRDDHSRLRLVEQYLIKTVRPVTKPRQSTYSSVAGQAALGQGNS